jgi:phosphoglycolate phosphatase
MLVSSAARGVLFFDLDGTLTDPREGIVGCIRHALQRLGCEVPPDAELERCIGPPLRESFCRLASDALADAAVEHYRERFRASGMFENSVYPGVPEALTALCAAGWQLLVVTSKPGVFAEQILRHFDLARYFSAIYGSELSGVRSDKGELIAYVLATERIASEHALMIGDRSHDIVGARKNGLRAAGVLWGYGTREELAGAGADRLYATVSVLVEDLAALSAASPDRASF